MSHLVPVKEYTDAASLLAGYADRKRRLAALFSTGIKEIQVERPLHQKAAERRQDRARRGAGIRWEVDEVSLLRRLAAERKNCREIAEELGRTPSSVSNKAVSLSLRLQPVTKPVRQSNRGRRRRDWLKLHVDTAKPSRAHKQTVLATVCDATGYTQDEIRGVRRDKHVIIARHIAYLMMKRHTPLSLPQIGAFLGDRDHTTILSGVGSIQNKAATDVDLAQHIESISALINARIAVMAPPTVAEAA